MATDKIDTVQIEGLVLLKIIKHCHENLPQQQGVTGCLLGLNINGILEITNSFSLIEGTQRKEYQETMLELMKDVREDHNNVGWYRSAFYGTFLTDRTIVHQYSYQKELPHAVCLIYDPIASIKGSLILRALRLTNKFMGFYQEKEHSSTIIDKYHLNSSDIFEELPIKIHNSHLVHALLYELREDKTVSCQFDRLHHYHSKQLTQNLKQLSTAINAYSSEALVFRNYYSKCYKNKKAREAYVEKYYQGRRDRKANKQDLEDLDRKFPSDPQPSRLESVTVSAQMNEYTEQIENAVLQGLAKVWVTQGLQQEKLLNQEKKKKKKKTK